MPRRLLPHVERFRDRHGKMRFYFRRGKGKRTALPSDPASLEFAAAWHACMAQVPAEVKRPKVSEAAPGTISALIVSYKRSSEYTDLSSSTKRGYSSRLESIRIAHGHRLVSQMTRGAIIERVMQPYAGLPGAGHDVLKKLRILIRHAINLEWITSDPSIGIRRPRLGEVRSWTDEEISVFKARWPRGTRQRTAFDLHLYTGQRVSDVHRMTWSDVPANSMRVTQQKTKVKLVIALHSELRATLAKTERKHVSILVTEYGKPFSPKGYGQWLRAAIGAAGLPMECQPHGLRKAAGRTLAEAGCSANQIMAILGHKSLEEAARYTRDAEQKLLAADGIALLENKYRTNVPNPSAEVWEFRQKDQG